MSTTATQASRGMHRRAKKACHSCHARKVRCDVARRGIPCSNCEDDEVPCLIRERKNKRVIQPYGPKSDYVPRQDSPSIQETQSIQVTHDALTHDVTSSGIVRPPSPNFPISESQFDATQNLEPAPFDWGSPLDVDLDGLVGLENVFNTSSGDTSQWGMWPVETTESIERHSSVGSAPNATSPLSPYTLIDVSEKVVGIAEDKSFLTSQGCFHLPSGPTLKQLMLAYFQFVHPNLPVVNEAEFWSLWSGDNFNIGSFSVMVVQAMSFAAAAFASSDVIQRLGYISGRKARIVLYRKAKLLFDFAMESDPIFLAQGSLLLTYYAPRINKHRINSSWLMHAIRYAKIAGADKFYELDLDLPETRVLKRLWWGCLLRDRILPLGVRRCPQIDECPPSSIEDRFLDAKDLRDERGLSPIHSEEVQCSLASVIELKCMLAEALTPALKLLYSVESLNERYRTPDGSRPEDQIDRAKACIKTLKLWHAKAIEVFPPPINLGDVHDTVAIFANLPFIYYEAAITALSAFSMLVWESSTSTPSPSPPPFYPALTTAISDSVRSTTARIRELVQSGLARYLPISCSAFLTLPTFLHALDLTAAAAAADPALEARRRRQMDIYTKAMVLQQNLYDGTDFCYDLIANITAYAASERFQLPSDGPSRSGTEEAGGGMSGVGMGGMGMGGGNGAGHVHSRSTGPGARSTSKRGGGMMSWEDLLVKKPRLFLRVAVHFDFAFCVGVPPSEEDFPRQVRIVDLKGYRGFAGDGEGKGEGEV